MVQVDVVEKRDQGVKISARCLFDSEVDGVASDTFTNNTMLCCASVFAIYLY